MKASIEHEFGPPELPEEIRMRILMVSWMTAETIPLGAISVRRMRSDEMVQFSKIRQVARNGLIVKNQERRR